MRKTIKSKQELLKNMDPAVVERILFKEKEKISPLKRTFLIKKEQAIILKELSKVLKVSQGKVIERLLDKAVDEYYQTELREKIAKKYM